MSKLFKTITIFMLVVSFSSLNIHTANAATKVMWGKTELKLGQIGKATILAETTLVKLESDGSISTVRLMKKGEEYRVYNYKSNHGGLFGVGGGSYIQKNEKVKYETPSKSKLALLQQESVPSEYKAALDKAKSYANINMSKQRMYDQLTSIHGSNFSKEAAQYAIENLRANWKENALKSAQSYKKNFDMSKASIYDQLISRYGGEFTPEEAQYAIDNLK